MNLPQVTVYGFVPLGELPDLSPFVSKVLAYLNYRKWPYTLKSGDLRKAPRGKLPYVEVDGRLITDSDAIITELERIHPEPLGLDQTERSIGICRAVQSMLENHFYFLAVKDRWGNPGCWQKLKPSLQAYLQLNGLPAIATGLVAGLVRKQVEKSTATQGVGRMSEQDRTEQVENILNSFEALLGGNAYLGGTQPERADFTAYAMFRGYSISLLDSPLTRAVQARPAITAYLAQLHKQFGK